MEKYPRGGQRYDALVKNRDSSILNGIPIDICRNQDSVMPRASLPRTQSRQTEDSASLGIDGRQCDQLNTELGNNMSHQSPYLPRESLPTTRHHDIQRGSDNSISGNSTRTFFTDNLSRPPTDLHDSPLGRQNLFYMNRFFFPLLSILLFTVFSSSILIYTFTLERPLPKKSTAVAFISLVTMLILWALFRIFEYCLWRRNMGRWYGIPLAHQRRRGDWESYIHRRSSEMLIPRRTWTSREYKNLGPNSSRSPFDVVPREKIRRRGAGKFWFSAFQHRFRSPSVASDNFMNDENINSTLDSNNHEPSKIPSNGSIDLNLFAGQTRKTSTTPEDSGDPRPVSSLEATLRTNLRTWPVVGPNIVFGNQNTSPSASAHSRTLVMPRSRS